MFEFIYLNLARIGFTHPLHPPLTHAPVGMVIGAFIFGLGAWILRHSSLAQAARYCVILALITLLPTALLGYMDWRHYYAGAWLFPIKMKLALAALLAILLVGAIVQAHTSGPRSSGALLLYALCLLNVTALGYFGGELVFGGGRLAQPSAAVEVRVSGERFTKSCSSCHPNGGNAIKPHLPLKSAPQLANFDTFLAYIRSPRARDGSQTVMPAFHEDKITERQAREIYRYIIQVLRED